MMMSLRCARHRNSNGSRSPSPPPPTPLTLALLLFAFASHGSRRLVVEACTNILVTPGASQDGSAMIAYDADSVGLQGMLYHYPNATSDDDGRETARKVWNWDTGKYLGVIPESHETYNVVGNVNERGLCIGETTFGGLKSLSNQPGAIIDYGSLIWITLQRASTAREAIRTMADLMDTYGYASEGESFSLADANEVWIMEVIGRGSGGKKGAVWVARRIPDGMVASHANQARIRTFPRNDPDNCLYADDVVDLARTMGLYSGADEDFSFSDTYDPVKFEGARFCEARVWSVFSAITRGQPDNFKEKYLDYATGRNLTNRMPLWIEPAYKLSLTDVMDRMRNHYEGTEMSFSQDVGAGPHQAPYRPQPLVWKYSDDVSSSRSYYNERSISTDKTAWNFVAQIRPHMPPPLRALVWFATDDSGTTPRVPVYGSARAVSPAYGGKGTQDGVPSSLLAFDISKAFWVQNMVSNLVYTQYNLAYDYLLAKLRKTQKDWSDRVSKIDALALNLYERGRTDEAIRLVTDFTVNAGDEMHATWIEFYGELFARYRDGVIVKPNPYDPVCRCRIDSPGIADDWKRRIVEETGTKYKVPLTVDEGGNATTQYVVGNEDGGCTGVNGNGILSESRYLNKRTIRGVSFANSC